MAAITIGTNGTFVPTTAQTYGVYIATLLVHGMISGVAVKYIARLQPLIVTLNILSVWHAASHLLFIHLFARLALAIIIALPAATPKEFKNTAGYAFGSFDNRTSGETYVRVFP